MPPRTPTTEATMAATPAVALDAAALDAIVDAVRLADPIIPLTDGRTFALIHERHRLQEVTDPLRIPAYVQQRLTIDNRRALVDYTNRFKDHRSILIADYTALKIHAHLDWHGAGDQGQISATPQPCKHVATLAILPSEEWKRWNEIAGKFLPQATFAAFLEENSVDIAYPEATVMMEISRDLEATTGQSFKSSTRLESGDRSFRFETETRVANEVKVPTTFTLSIPLYEGEDPMELRAAFRFRPTPEGLLLGFEWRRVEYQRRAHFAEIAVKAAEECGLPVFMGRTG